MTRKVYIKESGANPLEMEKGGVNDVQKKRLFGLSDVVTDNGTDENGDIEVNGTSGISSDEDDIDSLKSELMTLRQQSADDRDQLMRVSAEFENYKKRSQRHMDDFKKYANESLLKELLTVVDNLERAVSSSGGVTTGSPDACIVEGVEMTLKEIVRVLEKFHVTPIDALGKPFDPAFHEAVMREETDAYPDNTVCNVLQKGYMIHDRLLRPAMVSVTAA